jgi:hypothetical protein
MREVQERRGEEREKRKLNASRNEFTSTNGFVKTNTDELIGFRWAGEMKSGREEEEEEETLKGTGDRKLMSKKKRKWEERMKR